MEDQLQVGKVPIEISQMWHAWRMHQLSAVAGSLLTVAFN